MNLICLMFCLRHNELRDMLREYNVELFKKASFQDAVVRALEIVGEAAGHISEKFRETHPEIAWHKMIGMRNRLIHEYFRVNYGAVWDTVKNDLPDLIEVLKELVPPE